MATGLIPSDERDDLRHRLRTVIPSMKQLVIELESEDCDKEDALELAQMIVERLTEMNESLDKRKQK